MKRHAVALLVHPFRNRLIAPHQLKNSVDALTRTLDLASANQGLRLNVVLPGYIFEMVDSLMLPELREAQKRGSLEWLATGYTEPFLSFSPRWLTRENIRAGIQSFSDVLGVKPSGYVPPFSNWEPDCISMLRDLGINHAVLSNFLLPQDCRSYRVTWSTEHSGSSMVVFPMHTLHPYTAPAGLEEWLDSLFAQDAQNVTPLKILGIHYLLPLDAQSPTDPLAWLKSAAQVFDRLALKYQMVRFSEYLSGNLPFGLQYLPSGLMYSQTRLDVSHAFWNWLFTYDQVGIMHRKLMELCDTVEPDASARAYARTVKRLFSVQDINRFLPGTLHGFEHCDDRFWFYRNVIDIEKSLPKARTPKGGQIRIMDHLRTGTKSIIMTNAGLKVYIDHRSGGTVFELDLEDQRMNVFAGYNPRRHDVPGVVVPGKSKTAFVDHFISSGTQASDFMNGLYSELGDFVRGRFDYNIKKSSTGVKALLNRQGALLQGDKTCPLYMEKVFALEKDAADLSFVYQLTNRSLTPYAFTFAVELTLVLPGAARGQARFVCGDVSLANLITDRIARTEVTEFMLEDTSTGLQVTIRTQKPVNVWCFPVGLATLENPAYHGTTVVLSAPVSLPESAAYTLMGKIVFRGTRTQGDSQDAI